MMNKAKWLSPSHKRRMASMKALRFNVWLVVANERIKGKEEGWHWDDFFLHRHEWAPADFSWGGYEWIRSPQSLKCIRQMKRGDIIVAYQAGEGIVGLCATATGGYEEVPASGDINTFDIAPEPAIRLKNPVPLKKLKSDPRTCSLFRQLQGSVFLATQFWEALKEHILEENPNIFQEVSNFELAVLELRMSEEPQKDVYALMATEREPKYVWRGRVYRRNGERSAWLRKLYDFKCQICGAQFPMPDGRMAIDVHYLRPLQRFGPKADHPGNMLVLCPNHHLQVEIAEEVSVNWVEKWIKIDGAVKRLRIHRLHSHLASLFQCQLQR